MTTRRFAAIAGAAFLLALAAPAAGAAGAPGDLAAAWPVIKKANADWLPAMKAKDPEALAEPYAEDGVFILPDGRQVVGRKAIADFYRQRVANLAEVLDGGIHHDGMTRARDGLVYEWGHGGATTVDAAGHKATSGGPYLTVWKRGADGSWKIARNLVF